MASRKKSRRTDAAALPVRVFPPLFNRYQGGQSFGNHVDNAIRQVPGTPHRIRTDLSATLFFADPTNTTAASWWSRTPTACTREAAGRAHGAVSRHQPASRAAGDARRARRVVLLDPEHGARRRRSARCCSISTPPSSADAGRARSSVAVQLTGVYHNLLRRWAEV